MKNHLVQIPIFPLPTSFLFPGIYVPFHIFEERYRSMLKHVETNACHLAVSYAPEMQPGRFFPQMICGAGPVRVLKRFDSGEADILVFGKERVKFHRYIQEVPFLIGEGEILQVNKDMPTKTETALLTEIKEMLINWIFAKFDDSSRSIQFFKSVNDLEPLCNFVSYYFVSDLEKKQNLLEENELENKAQVVWQVLKDLEDSGTQGNMETSPPLIFPSKKHDDFN